MRRSTQSSANMMTRDESASFVARNRIERWVCNGEDLGTEEINKHKRTHRRAQVCKHRAKAAEGGTPRK